MTRERKPHETADQIIYAVLAALFVFGIIAFFAEPKYEKGVWAIIALLGATLSGATGFKFGITSSPTAPPQREDVPQG